MRKVVLNFVCALTLCLPVLARSEPVVIAALGDSLTQGFGLAQDQGFVPQMQRWLEAKGEQVVLINAGVSGDTTAGGAARVGWTLTPEVDGLIVALGGNDLLRGIDPGVVRANLDVILLAASAAEVPVLLIGMRAPGNFGPDYKRDFESAYSELSQQHGTIFRPDFLAGLGDAGSDPAALRVYLQADGIHPNPVGVARIVSDLGPAVRDLLTRIKSE